MSGFRSIAYQLNPVLILGCCAVVLILGKSLTNPNGYITNDSASYLELAARLLSGHGFTVLNNGLGVADSTHFATWPVGYPGLIAAVSKVLGVTPFIASKLLNASCLLIAMYAVMHAFRSVGPWLALIFLFAGTLENFSFTWSEAPFTMLLVLFAILLARFMDNNPPGIAALAGLAICALALFLMRYIGLFALGPILAIVTLHLARGSGITALRLGVAGAAVASAAFAYLSYNKLATGFSTGVPRVPAHETNLELLEALGRALVHELVLPIPFWVASETRHNVLLALTALALIYVAVRIAQSPVNKHEPKHRHLYLSFLLVGLFYLGAIIVARWNTYFDPFGYRLLNPGVALVLVGLFAALADRYSGARTAIRNALVLIAGMSLAVHATMLYSRAVPGGYKAALQIREEIYGYLPSGAIVLYGSPHLRYQRPDVHILHPDWHTPLSITQDFSAMMTAFDTRRPVYVEMNTWAQNRNDQPPALHRFLETCDPDFYIIRIRPETDHWLCEPIVRSSITVPRDK